MHPEIRRFPSAHFYDNLLTDGENVLATPDEPHYRTPCLGPYQFFDVRGREESGPSGSFANRAEADIAVRLVELLVRAREAARPDDGRSDSDAGAGGRATFEVGIVTPYRYQCELVRNSLRSRGVFWGPHREITRVLVETVDSFQGRQLDVIIFSCVRSSPMGNVGFVSGEEEGWARNSLVH